MVVSVGTTLEAVFVAVVSSGFGDWRPCDDCDACEGSDSRDGGPSGGGGDITLLTSETGTNAKDMDAGTEEFCCSFGEPLMALGG